MKNVDMHLGMVRTVFVMLPLQLSISQRERSILFVVWKMVGELLFVIVRLPEFETLSPVQVADFKVK
jgi:hypothetical protein